MPFNEQHRIRPWEMDLLTVEQFEFFAAVIDERQRAPQSE